MAMTINTNVTSLNAQRNLANSQNALQTSIERLSSGMRINSAKDDAAGLAISDRMTSQINGMDQASRNANDGVSMTQTADGALASSGDILQRIRELAVQSSNSTNTASDRQSLQAEATQLTSELQRISTTTTFNGQNLLDGSMGTANFQVGANANQLISISGANFQTNTYGDNQVTSDEAAVKATSNAAAAKITLNGSLGTGSYTTTTSDTAKSVAASLNNLSAQTGVTASAQTTANLALGGESYSLKLASDNASAVTVSFTVGGTGSTADDYSAAIAAFNAQSANTGVSAEYDATNGGIKLTNATGNDITLTNNAGANNTVLNVSSYKANGQTTAAFGGAATAGTSAVVNGTVTLDSNLSFSATDAGTGFGVASATGTASSLQAVSGIDVTSFAGAQQAIKTVDAALSAVDNQRAQYGAIQSRFDSVVSNLATSNQNLSAARSRITDTDFAAETANMTRAQVLVQAGTSVLAQANATSQGVLSLLR